MSLVMVTPIEHQGKGYATRLMTELMLAPNRVGLDEAKDGPEFLLEAEARSKATVHFFNKLRRNAPVTLEVDVASVSDRMLI